MTYNNSVLVGNWSEERLKNEYEFKLFLRKRDRRELLLQKSRTLFSNLLKERPLAISGSFVQFGFNVQLVASDMPGYENDIGVQTDQDQLKFFSKKQSNSCELQPNKITSDSIDTDLEGEDREALVRLLNKYAQYFIEGVPTRRVNTTKPVVPGTKPQYGLALSSLVRERQVDYTQNICDGCMMTLSPITTPCCRNTFVIVSVHGEDFRGKLNYGDEFLLRAENYGDPEAAPLYVRYTSAVTPEPRDRMPLRLSATKDSNCRFTAMPLLPCDRIEGFGSPVKTSARLIIKNCIADQSLCVMNQNWIQTFFGAECGVTCRNYIDIHGRFTAENIFTMVSDVETKSKK